MADLRGTQIKGYRMISKIDSGGFGIVYHATQVLGRFEREVAIKVIHPGHAARPAFIRRFEAEAQLVARLEHPHIVPLYDFWRDATGAFLVMRWMSGGTLVDLLRHGPLPPIVVSAIFEQIISALALAHRRGVIHRDVKPANILRDDEDYFYLADFGIAKDLDQSTDATGSLMFSAGYAAPEQITGEQVTPRADIYSLGVLLYELLVGQPPFIGTVAEVVRQQLSSPLPLIADSIPTLSSAIDKIIQKATERDPAARYRDVTHMGDDVRQALGEPDIPLTPWAPTLSPSIPIERSGIFITETAPAPEQLPLENPYKGLRAFQEADALDFFGRSELTRRLLARLAETEPNTRFLAVVGPSGSGKSSVVRAGLVPALKRGELRGAEQWFFVEIIPGAHPLEELEAGLLRIAVNPPPSLVEQLRVDERGLLRAVARVLPADERVELLLVIDQFEELFTLVASEPERAHLLQSLTTAVCDPRSRLRLVVTLRADFYDRPLRYGQLGELMRQRTEVVLPLSTEELEQAIVEPVRRVGVAVEPNLVTTIVRDVGAQPGALPMLQYALTELFERRNGGKLSLLDYQASGGVQGALAGRADELYAALHPQQQDAARQLLLRLVTLGEGGDDTRRRVRRDELLIAADEPANDATAQEMLSQPGESLSVSSAETVIEIYGRARLLTFDHDPITRAPTVEVAHEALIQVWGRLRQWLDASREKLRVHRRLAAAAADWQNAGRDPSFQARGAQLGQFVVLAAEGDLALNAGERAFLTASQQAQAAEERREEQARQAELAQAQALAEEQRQRAEVQTVASQRLRRRAVLLATALAVALLAMVGAGWFGVQSRQNEQMARRSAAEAQTAQAQAQAQLNVAESRRLAFAAEGLKENEAETALLLAIEAAARNINSTSEPVLRSVTARTQYLPTYLNGHTGPVLGARFGEDGQRIFTLSLDGTLRIWNLQGKTIAVLRAPSGKLLSGAISPDGKQVIAASEDGTILRWNADGTLIGTFDMRSQGRPFMSYSSDGRRILTVEDNGLVRLWDADGHLFKRLEGHTGQVRSAEFSPDATLIVTTSVDKTVRLWDANGNLLKVLEGHTDEVHDVAFSPDSTHFVTTSKDTTARIWDRSGHAIAVLGKPGNKDFEVGHTNSVDIAVYTRDGQRILTISAEGAIYLWRANGESIKSISTSNPIYTVDMNPDGQRFVTAHEDGTVRLWEFRENSADASILDAHDGAAYSARFSPDGKSILTASADGTARIWRPSGEQIAPFAPPGRRLFPFALSPDGQRLLVVNADLYDGDPYPLSSTNGERVQLWDRGGKLITDFSMAPADNLPSAVFVAGGERIIIYTWPSKERQSLLQIWDREGRLVADLSAAVPTLELLFYDTNLTYLVAQVEDGTYFYFSTDGQKLGSFNVPVQQFTPMSVSPDGQHIALRYEQNKIQILGMDGTLQAKLVGHTSIIGIVEFSPKGDLIATADKTGTGRLWDLKGTPVVTLTGYTDLLSKIIFSPDGQRLVTVSLDHTARLWDITGRLLATLPSNESISQATYSPDGRYIFTQTGTALYLWSADGAPLGVFLYQWPSRLKIATLSEDEQYLILIDQNGMLQRYPLDIQPFFREAMCRVGRGLTEEEIARFSVSVPLRFDFAKRQCP